jgi:hypothetical protein
MDIILNEKLFVDNWCYELCLENYGLLSSSENGNIYDISTNKVVKVTSDYSEIINSFNILNKTLKYHVNIYDIVFFSKNVMGILMEKVVTDDVSIYFEELEVVSDSLNIPINEIDYRLQEVSKKARKMGIEIKKSIKEIRKYGHTGLDINVGNIGMNVQGTYVLFDQIDNLIFEKHVEIKKIKNKLKNYEFVTKNIFNAFPISKIRICREQMIISINNISRLKICPKCYIEGVIDDKGMIDITNGYEHLVNLVLLGRKISKIKIVDKDISKNRFILDLEMDFKTLEDCIVRMK